MTRLVKLRWYYVTRLAGLLVLLYGVLGDHTGDRSTLIITGAGLLGIDKVARSEGDNGRSPKGHD